MQMRRVFLKLPACCLPLSWLNLLDYHKAMNTIRRFVAKLSEVSIARQTRIHQQRILLQSSCDGGSSIDAVVTQISDKAHLSGLHW
jgi:hypothetical protein